MSWTRTYAASAVLCAWQLLSGQFSHASANAADTMAAYTDKCMHQQSNRSRLSSAAWGREHYYYTSEELTEADKLNGVTAKGIVKLEVPIKTADGPWQDGALTFSMIEQHGIVTIEEPEEDLGGILTLRSAHWSCRFQNNVQTK